MKMLVLPASQVSCRVLTFKHGALSAMAHDLEIAVERFTLSIADDRSRIEAKFDPSSLRVLHAVADGRATSALSDRDKRKIERTIADDILDVTRYPEIRFVSSRIEQRGAGYDVEGTLSLHGRDGRVAFVVAELDGAWRAEVRIDQPAFGIRPYSAMFGALQVKPELCVVVAATLNAAR
ncbi:MAG: YceI family protein [Deltaproteobacteria bacterium]|nr:YceI family protein [Deltaproteobacteria bacterium]